jgi:hypothetical protein
MKRHDFLKLCAAGVCGCCSVGFLAPLSAEAEQGDAQTPEELTKRQLDFTRERFAGLLAIMGEHLDNATRDRILKKLGHECAQDSNAFFQKFRGDFEGFLATIQTRWVERTEYDEATDTLRVIGKVRPCVCPLVKAGRTPGDFCACSAGWNQYAYSTVLGKPVSVELEETVLRGGSRCTQRIVGLKG